MITVVCLFICVARSGCCGLLWRILYSNIYYTILYSTVHLFHLFSIMSIIILQFHLNKIFFPNSSPFYVLTTHSLGTLAPVRSSCGLGQCIYGLLWKYIMSQTHCDSRWEVVSEGRDFLKRCGIMGEKPIIQKY